MNIAAFIYCDLQVIISKSSNSFLIFVMVTEQRFGDGPDDELALESNGDYTRSIGNLKFSDFGTDETNNNTLNSVWFQPEEVFPIDGTPEMRQFAFWVPTNPNYFSLAEKLEVTN